MCQCTVSFASAQDVREFVAIATRQPFSVMVENDFLKISGKSIMGLFSMGLNRPLRVLFPVSADAGSFLQEVSPFLLT